MDKKLTDNEIVKALKNLLELVLVEGCLQRAKTISNAIDLINRLKADKEYYKKNRDKYQDNVMFLSKQCDELQAENERLKKNLETETNHITRLENQIERLLQRLKTAKTEAYKEFAEELKKKMVKHNFKYADTLFSANVATVPMVDNLLKEMVGDNQ